MTALPLNSQLLIFPQYCICLDYTNIFSAQTPVPDAIPDSTLGKEHPCLHVLYMQQTMYLHSTHPNMWTIINIGLQLVFMTVWSYRAYSCIKIYTINWLLPYGIRLSNARNDFFSFLIMMCGLHVCLGKASYPGIYYLSSPWFKTRLQRTAATSNWWHMF